MSERWKPKCGETYYYANSDGNVADVPWTDDGFDHDHYKHGNCFRTKAEAKAAAEKVEKLLLSLHEEQPDTDCSQLPKLTVEVFDRPDCPEWAKYAAVDEDGKARFHAEEPFVPTKFNVPGWCSGGNDSFIRGEFDAANWQNSLIERPVKKPELPEWCKVGDFVYARDIKCYFKIKEIYNDGILLQDPDNADVVSNLCTEFFMERNPTQAHYRPYEAEEMYELIGKYIEDAEEVMLVTGFYKKDNLVKAGDKYYDAERLFNECTINGTPCGKLVHLNEKAEWVE